MKYGIYQGDKLLKHHSTKKELVFADENEAVKHLSRFKTITKDDSLAIKEIKDKNKKKKVVVATETSVDKIEGEE